MVLGLALGWACITGHEPVRATQPTPVTVVPVVETLDEAPAQDAPERLDRALLEALLARNLQPTLLEPSRYIEGFSARRDTQRRVEFLAEPGLVLLVENEAAYYSQLSGKYRWTVTTTLTLSPSGLADTFETPVFLQYHHERAPEAVAAAAPVIERRVGLLLDEYLAAP